LQGKKKRAGRPPIPSQNIVRVMLMRAYFDMPKRVAQGFLRLFGEKLHSFHPEERT
jgi:hypothetical protein